MKFRVAVMVLMVSFICLAYAGPGWSEEKKPVFSPSDGIREVLAANVGKRVAVRTDAGEGLEGSIASVGLQLVHIEKLAGKDFYDAFVKIDRISSVTVKARGN